MSKILARAIITPDGTVLQTFTGHDYKEHLDKNGEVYMIDGGPSIYGRSSVNIVEPKHVIVTIDSPFEEIRNWFHWGSYGKSGKEKLTRIPLKDLTEEHIQAIINTQERISDEIATIFKKELAFRLKEDITNSLVDSENVQAKNSKKKI